ncbi:MAG TPA: gluconeogenesis factor YvcK family protein [Acidimicrobiales bacterium]|nr:gluconeogenesis factor YvcK family protein [Acidimicrobiales bacterium]
MNAAMRQSERFPGGPRVVAIGGGHGQAKSLAAIRQFASSVTAIVSVADDGGSSGRLRKELGIPAPGDLRRCVHALLPEDSLLGDALEHRFGAGELEGHAFGNLLLAALCVATDDFADAVGEACRLLDTVGVVWPATTTPVTLCASTRDSELAGQVRIMATEGVTEVSLNPIDAPSPEGAIRAIKEAEMVVLGPGSLYTSVLAALVPRDVRDALHFCEAKTVYVCNLRQQIPETAGYSVGLHVEALIAHGITPDVVIADTREIDLGEVPRGVELRTAALTSVKAAVHDVDLLAKELVSLLP